ncbi:MAG: NADPH-dependent ferric siderophore reductase [Rhizobiales bacterium]|nr:NADPH-dependent ferric siderophore reductase [Hyphomicrobiales bacterium]
MNTRPEPRTFQVLSTRQVTPNMRRVTIGGPAMAGFPPAQDGGYLKLMLPGEADRPSVRTYTIRRQTADALDIDFALHGEAGSGGPAVAWSLSASAGDEITAGGPGPAKPLPDGAEWYFAVGDMTALPAISVNLEALPADAVGDVVIEVQTEADRQELDHPEGVTIHWVINPEPGHHPELLEEAVRAITWRPGRVYAWSATEFEVMRRLRTYLRAERGLGPDQLYISSYWKQGLEEDSHRVIKRADAEEARA